jgi:predicted acetyltransferase
MAELKLLQQYDNGTREYALFIDTIQVGFSQLRSKPKNSKLLPPNMASHIYYEIDDKFRGRGYGSEMLHLLKNEAKNLGYKELLLCVDESNVHSQKIIIKNGGEFINEYKKDTGIKALLYKIKV